MNQFLKKGFLLSFVLSVNLLFAQKGDYSQELELKFQPMFSFGAGFYSFQGDIMGSNTSILSGNRGFHTGMRVNIMRNIETSFMFSKVTLAEVISNNEKFSSDLNCIGLKLDYLILNNRRLHPFLSAGIDYMYYNTNLTELNNNIVQESQSFVFPLGFGLMMNISERMKMDLGLTYLVSFVDIDQSSKGNSDNYLGSKITIHYDLFTSSKKKSVYYDESYYKDVNFKALDVEDADGDLIPDIDDYCPKTPRGVKVDVNGCPLDSDNDGIADYLDKQKNTKKGAIVDEEGVELTKEQYKSMYSESQVASREYANFYNESEINREDFQTINEYFIAKANAFNKQYNQIREDNIPISGKRFKVQIGKHYEDVPPNEINKYLSLGELESIPQDDGSVIYAVGSFVKIEEALSAQFDLEDQGFSELIIIIDENGTISQYVPHISSAQDNDLVVESDTLDMKVDKDSLEIKEDKSVVTKGTIYRIQIGAFNDRLSEEIFVGVDNVISFTGKDGFIRYMTGSFTDYSEATNYMLQMRARGFEDAFVVTFRDGERISLSKAIKKEKKVVSVNNPENIDDEELVNIEYTVQVLVGKESLSAVDIQKMAELGNIEKERSGIDMYRYFSGTYSSLEEANKRLQQSKAAGFGDAFIFAKINGERITIEESKQFRK